MTHFFGERWDAPIVDDAIQNDTPVGKYCLGCDEAIVEGDQGLLMPFHTTADYVVEPEYVLRELGRDDTLRSVLTATHRECHMLGIIGHMVGVCWHSPQGGSMRDQAKEAMRRWETYAQHIQTG